MRRIGATARTGALVLLAAVTACGGTAQEEDDHVDVALEQTSKASIFGGAPDSEIRSGVVALRIGAEAPFEICSGALVAPNVVLTARHCVSRMVATSVVCTDRGQSANGAHVGEDRPTETITVFTGEKPDFRGFPQASAAAIVHRGGTSLCNSDLALVVLDRPVPGALPLSVRMFGNVSESERIRAIGYGRTESDHALGRRLRRDDVGVLAVGARLTQSATALGDREFEVGRSICQGDSGGPSISVTSGAIVGIVSRGADCQQDFGHVYTQTSGFEGLFGRALQEAGATITHEDGRILRAHDLGTDVSTSAPASEGCSVRGAGADRDGFGSFASLAALGVFASLLRRRARRP